VPIRQFFDGGRCFFPRKLCRMLELDDVVGSNAKVIVGSHRSPPFGLSAFTMSVLRGSFDASFGDSPIEDDVDVRIILEALEEMPVEPLVLARNHEPVSHAEAILRRSPVMHVQNSSRALIGPYPERSG
jgi:hypothetical protein